MMPLESGGSYAPTCRRLKVPRAQRAEAVITDDALRTAARYPR
jgi:hypothetical protein